MERCIEQRWYSANLHGQPPESFQVGRIPNGHAHLFRDTFATKLLSTGVPLERVSVMLGHSSIKVTEKHYSPWVRGRVRISWKRM